MAAQAPVCAFGWNAPGFTLRATDGRTYSLSDLKGEHGTLCVAIAATQPRHAARSPPFWQGARR
jgi:hypothetical protein